MRGELDNRDRDEEFNSREQFTKAELIDMLTDEFAVVNKNILNMTPQMLSQAYEIQGRHVSLLDIIFGAATHASEHLGQVLFIAKIRLGEQYQIQWAPHRRR